MAESSRVLIADDSPTVVDMVRQVLESAGYQVLTAPDGLAAMNIAYRELPDLVISDVEMPEMTGLQLCRLLKGDPRTRSVPFLILSHRKEQYDQFWGRETGADDYLPKPFGPEVLLARVRALLARSPRQDDAAPATPAATAETTRLDALEQVNSSLERRLFELTVVHGISAIAAVTDGERETARAVLERLARLVDFGAGALSFAAAGSSYLLIRKGTHPDTLQGLCGAMSAATGGSATEPGALPSLLSGAEFVSAKALAGPPSLALQPLTVAGRVVGVLALARDAASPFREPERDLMSLVADQTALVLENARLEEAERAHAAMLEKQNEELRRLNRTITDLIGTVTHDLRTPLNSVMGYLDLVMDDSLSEEQRGYLEVAQRNADRMLKMISNLLDVSRLEARRVPVTPEPMPLGVLLTSAVQTLRPAFEAKRQEYVQKVPADLPMLMADPELMDQVLLNLLSNASKYTPEGGSITVTARQEGDRVRVSVRDNGIGLSEEDRSQIFSKFFRAHRPETAGITGTGLGLAIVKSIVEQHNGEVFVESRLNEGSTFGFLLPIAEE